MKSEQEPSIHEELNDNEVIEDVAEFIEAEKVEELKEEEPPPPIILKEQSELVSVFV